MGFAAPLVSGLGSLSSGVTTASALTGAAGIIGAVGQYQAGKNAAAQSEYAAEVGKVQADQIDANYREELNSTIANIRAIRASAGVGANSPTGRAIEAGHAEASDRDRRIDVGSKRMQATQDENDARFRRSSANMALLGGTAKSLPAFFGA
ncbi:hypothetical protein MRS76_11220 [Rhizobiaceae bacterium n13]|uniref:hypothetical protein n=1 Tax=Ferirhizobium litorale TaxID=2927786 RepID=UPI0024B29C51|nr:hypothetical protein [Fererhizobium litorale]MDI7862531.1 hypothetical protein [Fererhizobium litorale]